MPPAPRPCPEILAPAGTEEAFAAALASGADAVFFGLAEGFNARARSTAFTLEGLPELVRRAHRAHVKVYLTLNTLVFERELEALETLLRGVVTSGVDALIVQDPAVAFVARRLAPAMRLHASTQMTISSSEGALFAATLGVSRVVLPRELDTGEIAAFVRESPLESEVFVHGALCMSWSGQCLTSEAFSERSANRGQCSQACRMPYQAIVDGERLELGDLRYLLSPEDLAAHEALPELVAAGVHGLKIEGRYKGRAYVAAAVDSWRHWRDALLRGVTDDDRVELARDVERAELTFSRGGSLGFLHGDNHQTLVVALTPKHRGLALGRVREVRSRSVVVELEAGASVRERLRPGVGLKFELVGRSDDEHDPENAPGGPLFSVRFTGARAAELGFGQPGPDLERVRPGDALRLTSDPELARDAERRSAEPVSGRIPLELVVEGRAGEPLRVTASARHFERSLVARAESVSRLEPSRGAGLDGALVTDKLGALGGSAFRLEALDVGGLAPGLYLPVSELKELRRELVAALEPRLFERPRAALPPAPCVPALKRELARTNGDALGAPAVVPLCRTAEQLEAVIASGFGAGDEVELDWMELVGLGRAVERARAAGLRVTLATVRVQKPGEEAFDRRLAALAPDAVLVRHWGALMHFSRLRDRNEAARRELALHGDFSLNVTNSLTAHHLLELGL
ncbi:MAG TPA: DUF3656 domain-containing protein, partial [Polyangiaceae bacterium]|nr:DUF3656 domain-containing protein [Polyangiaceae bacterium]